MNCPSCGTSFDAGQQFCRTCGAALTEPGSRSGGMQMRMVGILAVIFIGIVIAIAGNSAGIRWLQLAGVFVAIGGMFSMAAAALMSEGRGRGRSRSRRSNGRHAPIELERADTTNKLPPVPAGDLSAPSVTENTTELLKRNSGS